MKQTLLAKRVISILGLLAFIPGVVFAHSDEANSGSSDTRSSWEHVQEMQLVIHEAKFTTTDITYGIETAVTSDDKDMVDAIHHEVLAHEDELQEAFDEYTITAEESDNGATFTFQAEDDNDVKYLQENGNYVLVGFLMNAMRELMHEEGSGFDMMGDYGLLGSTMMSGGMMGYDYGTTSNTWRGGDTMMGFGTFLGGGMWFGWIVLIGIIIAIVYVVARQAQPNTKQSAKDILDQRFAKGEIDEKEYGDKKKALE